MTRRIARLLRMVAGRVPVVTVLIALAFFGGWGLWVLRGRPADVILGAGIAWLPLGWLIGDALRSLLLPEIRLLPGLREALLGAAGLLIALGMLMPGAAVAVDAGVFAGALTASGLLAVAALALARGLGYRIVFYLFWPGLILSNWYPALSARVVQIASATWLTPLVLTLSAVLIAALSLRPLWTRRDRDSDRPPMQSIVQGIRGGDDAASANGQAQRPNWVRRRFQAFFDATADYTFRRALESFRRRASARRRQRTVRAVLLPYDNVIGTALSIGLIASFATLFLTINPDVANWQPRFVGFYAVVLGMTRIQTVPVAMTRMRPSLAEMYMTLAPATTRDFQATVADALRWLVVVATLQALAYSALIAALLHARAPARLMLATGISAVGMALAGLGIELVVRASTAIRIALSLVFALAAAAVYALVYALLSWLGLALGGALGALVVCGLGAIVWRDMRELYMRRVPCFDAELKR